MQYWPSPENIRDCIRTEAEELSEHVLLAVHEPMRFSKRDMSGRVTISDEADLLDTFLNIERPIPIIGASGVGKSHIIRWLHAQLKADSRTDSWHIVRVPKNASLQQVLESLLSGLDGEEFEHARDKIKSVGETIKPLHLAQMLLSFMRQQLTEMYEENETTIQRYRDLGKRPNQEEEVRIRTIKTHASEYGLGALINDPYFQESLLAENRCFFKIAKRWAQGAEDDEVGDEDYQVHLEDLGFEYNINNLSINAREYVRDARLMTDQASLEQAVEILNEVMIQANQKAFSTLFSFSNGSFQDLFKEIRRKLHHQGRTLVILVEDMAAISAIENVLIDSLLEEGMRDGENAMCAVRSAIAVTEGYGGYARRQGTITTRATAEWLIEERVDAQNSDESLVIERMVDFCSRYINAARHGVSNLKSSIKIGQSVGVWVDESADMEYLDQFDHATSTHVPLFPLSRRAINALARYYCVRDNVLRFNPRLIINKILLPVLRDGRPLAEKGIFPPSNFCRINPPQTLIAQIRRLNLEFPERSLSLAAIWGYGARDFALLKENLSSSIAKAFNLLDFAAHLEEKVPTPVQPISPLPQPSKPKSQGGKVEPNIPTPEEEPFDLIELELEKWFRGEQGLSQSTANNLRKALNNLLKIYTNTDLFGVKEIPSLSSGTILKIIIPFPQTRGSNKASWIVEFCTEDEFKDKSTFLFHAAKALLRYQMLNADEQKIGWDYKGGREDFYYWQTFAEYWAPKTIKKLIDAERAGSLETCLSEHFQIALQLGIFKQTDSAQDKLNKMLLTSTEISQDYKSALTPRLNDIFHSHLEQWDRSRNAWLDLVAKNDYGLDGWIIKPLLRRVFQLQPRRQIHQNFEQAKKELSGIFSDITMFEDCTSSEEFTDLMESLLETVHQLQRAGDYPKIEGIKTAKTFINYIKEISNGHFSTVRQLIALKDSATPLLFWQSAFDIDVVKVEKIVVVLQNWKLLFKDVLPKLKIFNAQFGGDEIQQVRTNIDKNLSELKISLDTAQEAINVVS